MGLVENRKEKRRETNINSNVFVCNAEFAMTEGQKRKEEMKVKHVYVKTTKVIDASLAETVEILSRNGIFSCAHLLVHFYQYLRISN